MRPYFAFGRSQMRVGVKVRRNPPAAEPWRYYWVGLNWQLP